LSNLLLLGQDWVMFLGVQDGRLAFFSDFKRSDPMLYTGLLVPQAWTLGVELSFYLIAPWVLKDVRRVLALLSLSLALRVALVLTGIGLQDPWTYRFFPTELALFLVGALAQRYLLPFWEKFLKGSPVRWEMIGTLLLVIVSIVYSWIPVPEAWRLGLFLSA